MPSLTRRQALRAGAAAAALAAVRPGRAAARDRGASFTLDLPSLAGASAAGWHRTAVFRAPARFDLIGLGWARASRARAQVRARRDGGRWTPWTELPGAGDHGPDVGRGVAGTDPVWTGPADEFQLRVQGRPRALQARFVRAGRPRRRLLAHSARRQIPGAPPIIPRAEWGGDTVIPRTDPAYGSVQIGFVHHTVNANDYGPEDSAGIVLAIARYHRDHNGWNDLGYNFVVDRYGQIFEGRAGGIDQAIVGAQAQGFNSVSTGIACIGTFTSEPPPEGALDAIARVLGWKLTFHGVPVQGTVTVTSAGGETNRYPSGTAVTFERISGHRDGNNTECPGDGLYDLLGDLRTRASQYAGPLAGLTLKAAATRLRGTTSAALSGTLRFAGGGSAAGAPVDILYAQAGGAPGPIARVACASDGSWSTTIDLPRTGSVQARFPGDRAHAALESPMLRIRITPNLSLALSGRHIRRRRPLRVTGFIDPVTDTSVRVILERKVGRRYVRVRRRSARVVDGAFARTLRPSRRGLYRVTVRASGASARQYVRVKR